MINKNTARSIDITKVKIGDLVFKNHYSISLVRYSKHEVVNLTSTTITLKSMNNGDIQEYDLNISKALSLVKNCPEYLKQL